MTSDTGVWAIPGQAKRPPHHWCLAICLEYLVGRQPDCVCTLRLQRPGQAESLGRYRCFATRIQDLEEVRRLLVAWCNGRQSTYIRVDALDECMLITESTHLPPLLKALPHLSTKLYVTSQSVNQDIRRVFTKMPNIRSAAPTSEQRYTL